MAILVTTGMNPQYQWEEKALELSQFLNIPYIPRNKNTIKKICQFYNSNAALVIANNMTYVQEGIEYKFHPNMAKVRIKNILNGQIDRLVNLCQIQDGDSFLDCTCGLGSDSIVASHVIGEAGKIKAIESSKLLYTMVSEGFNSYRTGLLYLQEAMERIELVQGHYLDILKKEMDNSFDIVYFDPMFSHSHKESKGLELIRNLGDYSPLTPQGIKEALRVCKKKVVIKDGTRGKLLKSLNIPIVSKSNLNYGILCKE